MKIRQFVVDAFASRPFEGNPAAVVPLGRWLPDPLLQSIAAENNLSETAFFVPSAKKFHLRWFSPLAEIDLCGHATLAAAHVLYGHLAESSPELVFETRSGDLTVRRENDFYSMDFPVRPLQPCVPPDALVSALGVRPMETFAGEDYVAVLGSEQAVRDVEPDLPAMAGLDRRGVVVTALSRIPGIDFVSRMFAPKAGIPEDPVTGSSHCALAPFWAARMGKNAFVARQLSKRGGDVRCRLEGTRVVLSGRAVTFLSGEIEIPDSTVNMEPWKTPLR